ncbi:Hypothetical protein, putative [Bodo saltans]|uniref:UBC core domain-containing protein n=1 Tax=Bodo saltans TaxID=75058 RepID=A0A0S4JNP1_BODSA|nr:Hypothetical protein, putative [Bodo saltans]|eukprot:CUG91848.1 Hypothetical protein, putative [Bodo saltans]
MATDLSKIQADLQRKLSKARPVVAMVEKGELKILSDAEQKLIDMYPKWTAALEEVRAGKVPRMLTGGDPQSSQQDNKTPQKKSNGTAAVAVSSGHSAASNEDDEDADDMGPLFMMVARELLSAEDQSPKQRKALLENHVASLVSTSTKSLTAAKKEFDRVAELRTEIRAGRIERPSKAQLTKVMTYETLKKEVQRWTENVKSQQAFVREGIEDAVRRLEAGGGGDVDVDRTDDEVDAGGDSAEDDDDASSHESTPEAEQPSQNTEAAAQDEEVVAPVEVERDVTPEVASKPVIPPPSKQEESEEEDDEEEEEAEQPAGDDDDDDNMFGGFDSVFSVEKQKKQAKKEKATLPAAASPQSAPTAVVVTAQLEEAEVEPAAVVEPPKKKEIDWSELKCQKNKPRLADLVAAAQAEAARDASPSASNGKASPNVGKPEAPLEFLHLDIGSGQGSTQSKKSLSSGGKKQTAGTAPSQSPVVSAMMSVVSARVTKELRYALTNPLVHVRVCSNPSDAFTWCVNVSPSDGPLSGVIVPLRMTFTPQYPLAPPLLYSLVDIPHPNIITVGSQRNTLCLEHTTADAWDPATRAYSLLVHLETFFSEENFQGEKKSQAAMFASKIKFARRDCSRFIAADGSSHSPANPEPAASLWNGPFLTLPNKVSSGSLVGPGSYAWGHRFAIGGTLPFHSMNAQLLGTAIAGGRVDLVLFQKTESAGDSVVSFRFGDGVVTTSEQLGATNDEKNTNRTTVATWDSGLLALESTLQIQLHLKKAPFSAKLLSGNDTLATVELPASTVAVRPIIVLDSGANRLRCQFSLNEDLPSAAAPSADANADAEPLQCFLTLAAPDEAVLGPYVEVISRSKAGFVPTEVNCIHDEVVSVKAIDQVRHRTRVSGRRIDGMIPLCLDADHTRRSIPELKKQLMRLARNPSASTLYDPPFRASAALFIIPAALNDVVRQIQKIVANVPKTSAAAKASEVSDLVVLYARLLHTFAVLASQTPTMATEAATLAAPSSGHILAWSHLLDASWPEILRLSLQADGVVLDNAEGSFQKYHKGRRLGFLVGAALTHAMRTTSIQRLAEDLSSRSGQPAADVLSTVVPELFNATRVNTWDGVEEWVGVSFM